jgi:hypothetical protein
MYVIFAAWDLKLVRYSRKFVLSEYVISDMIKYKIKKELAGVLIFSSLLTIFRYKRVRFKWSRL